MQTDLCDISDLVDGLSKDWHRTWGGTARDRTDISKDISVPEASELRFVNQSPELSVSEAVAAIDQVLAKYPSARWTVTGDTGRITAGDRLISLAIPLADPDCETLAWLDSATRLGDGNAWNAKMVG